ncbi:MAG: Ig-like domain-containing protein, partial [Phycisphaerales bacterium JB041]
PGNTPPTVTISSPSNNATFTQGDTVTFAGSANDAEDGNLSSSITWTSSRDGVIGSGAGFSTSTLSVGTHTVTADATDSDGASGDDSVTVIIDPPQGTAPAAPDGVSATNLTNRYARVDWNDNSNNETSFEIQREKYNSRRNQWRSTTTFTGIAANSTSYTDRPGTGLYRYRVRASNGSGDSAWSAWAEVNVTRR